MGCCLHKPAQGVPGIGSSVTEFHLLLVRIRSHAREVSFRVTFAYVGSLDVSSVFHCPFYSLKLVFYLKCV